MTLKTTALIAAFLAFGANFCAADVAEIATAGEWSINRDSTMGGGCYMIKEASDGAVMMLGFDLSVDKAFITVFTSDVSGIEDDEIYPVTLHLNGEIYEAEAIGIKGDDDLDGLLTFFEDGDFLVDIANGQTLTLSQDQGHLMSLDLKDTKPAVLATIDCLAG